MEAVGRGLAEPRIVCVCNGRVSACVSVTPRTSAQTGEDTGEVKPNPQHRVCAVGCGACSSSVRSGEYHVHDCLSASFFVRVHVDGSSVVSAVVWAL